MPTSPLIIVNMYRRADEGVGPLREPLKHTMTFNESKHALIFQSLNILRTIS